MLLTKNDVSMLKSIWSDLLSWQNYLAEIMRAVKYYCFPIHYSFYF